MFAEPLNFADLSLSFTIFNDKIFCFHLNFTDMITLVNIAKLNIKWTFIEVQYKCI